MPTMTEERRATAAEPKPTEVVVRVDGGRRRPSLVGTLALAGLAVVIVIGLVLGGWFGFGNPFSEKTIDRSAPVILHKLQNLSSYRAASATFSVTIDEEKDVSILPQFLAGSRVIYNGYGSVDVSVDLGALDAQHVTRTADGGIIVTLPPATLEPASLDPGRSHVTNRDRGFLDRIGSMFVDSPTSERALERAAITKMNRAARRSALVARAERNTETMIKRLGAAVGVTSIDVRFANASSAPATPSAV